MAGLMVRVCLVLQQNTKLPSEAPGHVAFPAATRESARCPTSRQACGAVGGAGLGPSDVCAGVSLSLAPACPG